MVAEDIYNSVQLDDQTGGRINRTLEPASFLSVQSGDVVGFYTTSQGGNDMEGIRLVLREGEEAWHFATTNSDSSESSDGRNNEGTSDDNEDDDSEDFDGERRSIPMGLGERACRVAASAFTNSAPVLKVEVGMCQLLRFVVSTKVNVC